MIEPTDEQLANLALARFQADLLKLVQSEPYNRWPHVVINGLIETAGTLMRAAVWHEPAGLPTLLHQIDCMRDYVQPAAVAPGPPWTEH